MERSEVSETPQGNEERMKVNVTVTELTPSFIAASLHNKTIYILGDLNCNLLNLENPDSRALLDFCRLYNLSQMVKTPTRVTPSTETLIDKLFNLAIPICANKYNSVDQTTC